ncbi:MAG TPA: PCP reductase family protein [Thermoanaerobaculia bacterium]|nr:PCP reductase family protein [Thermoanaerobaculia bacterium]
MKFLCVSCDEPMRLTEAGPPDAAGSLSVLFACPACSRQIAMLTNPSETQLVSSLGVKIGPAAAAGAGEPGASKCPFSGMVQEMEQSRPAAGPRWTAEALARLDNIPDFVRPMARQGVEHYATTNGHAVVDERVLDEARTRFGM